MLDKIKSWFKNSVTIAWARVQTVLGTVFAVLGAVDLSPLTSALPAKWAGVWLVISGIITEIARRRTLT